jgi:chemotaxis protein methyltransferase CheR
MKNPAAQPLLSAMTELLARQVGLHFPPERWGDLMRGLEHVAREQGNANTDECMVQLLAAPLERQQIETLGRHLTIGETYFFREPKVFEALQAHVLPDMIQARRQSGRYLRVWSAGCSTGEEAYSLAILLQRAIPDFRQWDISILATDINPQALEKAETGIFSDWSFRNAAPWLREGYFRETGSGRYEILPAVRSMVKFDHLNLARDAYPSPTSGTNKMDIVFCRNVLMYFEPELAASVVGKLHQSLVEDGWLVVSPSEISQAAFTKFSAAHLPGAILHRKNAVATETARPAVKESQRPLPRTAPAKAHEDKPVRRPRSPAAATPRADTDYEQALDLYRKGRYPETVAFLSRLLETSSDARAMLLMARSHADLGELPPALHWCERTVAADRLHPAGHYLLGTILQEVGRKAEALLAYRRALYLDPHFTLAHFALGVLHREQHQPRQAAKHFTNALQLLEKQPTDAVVPESSGLTAGRLTDIIRSGLRQEERAA